MTWLKKKSLESCSETNFSTNMKNIWEENLEMPTTIPLKKGKRKKKLRSH